MANIDGTNGNDELFGTSASDVIHAKKGDDIVFGLAGDDQIFGGTGNDSLFGGDGADQIFGGTGNDSVDGGSGDDEIYSDKGDDIVDGGAGNDTIYSGSENDTIYGGSGDDIIDAGRQDDSVEGGLGNDTINAGHGNDIVAGGEGDDSLMGGQGFDVAVFSGSITDFSWVVSGGGFVVTDLNAADGDEGVDTILGFEELQFDDFTLNVDGGNNAPLVVDPGAATDEDNATSFSVSTYDFDGDALTLDSFTYNGLLGTLTLDSTSAFTPAVGTGLALNFIFDPSADYESLAVGATAFETFTVTVSDGNGGVTTETFNITINGVNDDPTLAAGVGAAVEDGAAINVDLSALGADVDSDDDGTTLTYTVTGQPTEGSASITDGTLTFDPGSDFQNLALNETRDVVVQVTATDAHGATAVNDVTITVTGTNDDPTMAAGVGAAVEDGGTINVDLSALGDDIDSDNDGTNLIYTVTSGPGAGEGSASITDGVLSFDPGNDFQGLALDETQDVVIQVTATDAHGATAVNDVTITVTGTNDAPTMAAGEGAAVEDGATVDVDLSLLGDDVDSDNNGTNLIYTIIGILAEGGASISGSTLTFDPGSDFQNLALGETRDVVITVQAEDAHGAATTADITITVTGTNDAPTMVGAVGAAQEDGGSINVDLSAFGADVDSDDDGASLSYAITGAPTEGTAAIIGTTLTFDPGVEFQDLGAGETRDVTVTVEVTDSNGATTTEEVTITVTGTNDAPVAQDTSLAVDEENGPIVIDLKLLTSDVDANDTLSHSVVSIVDVNTGRGVIIPLTIVNGIVTIDSAEFGLDEGEVQDFVLTYLVDDGNGGQTTGEITLTVTGAAGGPTPPVNNAPVANDLVVNADEADGFIVIDLNDLVTDADGGTPAITSVTFYNEGHATAVVFTEVNGVVTIDPAQFGLDEGEVLDQTFEFTVDDGSGATNSSAMGTVNLILTGAPAVPPPANAAPVANDRVDAAVEESAGVFQIDLNALVSDTDTGDVLTIGSISFSQNGVEIPVNFTIAGGIVSIDPEQFGLDDGQSFTGVLTYIVDDGSGAANSSATGEVTFTVNGEDEAQPPANNAPVTVDQSLSINLDTFVGDFSFDLSGINPVFVGDVETANEDLVFTDLSFTCTIVTDPETGTTQTFDVVYTIVDSVVTFDPTQFGLLDGENLGVEFTYSVDDGSGASNSSTTGIVVVSIDDPLDVVAPTLPRSHLLDFEPFDNGDPDDNTVSITTYEEFLFIGDVEVLETDESVFDPNTETSGRSAGLPQGVLNGSVSANDENVLAMEANGSLTISGPGAGVEGVGAGEQGTFNLDSLYLTSSLTEGMTVTFTTFELGLVDFLDQFGNVIGQVAGAVEAGTFVFVVGTADLNANGVGGNLFIDFNTVGDPSAFDDILSVEITTDAGSNNLLIIDDISATVVSDAIL